MAKIKWVSDRASQPISILSVTGTAAGAATADSSAISNDAELDLFADLELNVTFASAPTANEIVSCYILPTVDLTNYATLRSQTLHVGNFVLASTDTTQRLFLRGVVVPPNDFKVVLVNGSAVAFHASTATTLKAHFYKYEVA